MKLNKKNGTGILVTIRTGKLILFKFWTLNAMQKHWKAQCPKWGTETLLLNISSTGISNVISPNEGQGFTLTVYATTITQGIAL